MQTRLSHSPVLPARRAFSLIELLTAVSIMLVIIFALYSMFHQTQKALRANLTQVDVLESGRAASEMLGRELEQLAACNLGRTTNFYARLGPVVQPWVQTDLDETTPLRINMLQEIFFLRQETNSWVGTGYRVMRADHGVGTLFRFTASTNMHWLNRTNLTMQFENAVLGTNQSTGQIQTNFHRVADGIVHLRVTAYDPEGRRLGFETTNMYPTYSVLRQNRGGDRRGLTSTANTEVDATVILRQAQQKLLDDQTQVAFLSNALPGYLELELGVLEPATLKYYESLRDSPPAVAESFLRKQAAKVHLFRQRIPIRTALR